MNLAEAIVSAIQEEADDLGCNGDEFSERISQILDRITVRINNLIGDSGCK